MYRGTHFLAMGGGWWSKLTFGMDWMEVQAAEALYIFFLGQISAIARSICTYVSMCVFDKDRGAAPIFDRWDRWTDGWMNGRKLCKLELSEL